MGKKKNKKQGGQANDVNEEPEIEELPELFPALFMKSLPLPSNDLDFSEQVKAARKYLRMRLARLTSSIPVHELLEGKFGFKKAKKREARCSDSSCTLCHCSIPYDVPHSTLVRQKDGRVECRLPIASVIDEICLQHNISESNTIATLQYISQAHQQASSLPALPSDQDSSSPPSLLTTVSLPSSSSPKFVQLPFSPGSLKTIDAPALLAAHYKEDIISVSVENASTCDILKIQFRDPSLHEISRIYDCLLPANPQIVFDLIQSHEDMIVLGVLERHIIPRNLQSDYHEVYVQEDIPLGLVPVSLLDWAIAYGSVYLIERLLTSGFHAVHTSLSLALRFGRPPDVITLIRRSVQNNTDESVQKEEEAINRNIKMISSLIQRYNSSFTNIAGRGDSEALVSPHDLEDPDLDPDLDPDNASDDSWESYSTYEDCVELADLDLEGGDDTCIQDVLSMLGFTPEQAEELAPLFHGPPSFFNTSIHEHGLLLTYAKDGSVCSRCQHPLEDTAYQCSREKCHYLLCTKCMSEYRFPTSDVILDCFEVEHELVAQTSCQTPCCDICLSHYIVRDRPDWCSTCQAYYVCPKCIGSAKEMRQLLQCIGKSHEMVKSQFGICLICCRHQEKILSCEQDGCHVRVCEHCHNNALCYKNRVVARAALKGGAICISTMAHEHKLYSTQLPNFKCASCKNDWCNHCFKCVMGCVDLVFCSFCARLHLEDVAPQLQYRLFYTMVPRPLQYRLFTDLQVLYRCPVRNCEKSKKLMPRKHLEEDLNKHLQIFIDDEIKKLTSKPTSKEDILRQGKYPFVIEYKPLMDELKKHHEQAFLDYEVLPDKHEVVLRFSVNEDVENVLRTLDHGDEPMFDAGLETVLDWLFEPERVPRIHDNFPERAWHGIVNCTVDSTRISFMLKNFEEYSNKIKIMVDHQTERSVIQTSEQKEAWERFIELDRPENPEGLQTKEERQRILFVFNKILTRSEFCDLFLDVDALRAQLHSLVNIRQEQIKQRQDQLTKLNSILRQCDDRTAKLLLNDARNRKAKRRPIYDNNEEKLKKIDRDRSDTERSISKEKETFGEQLNELKQLREEISRIEAVCHRISSIKTMCNDLEQLVSNGPVIEFPPHLALPTIFELVSATDPHNEHSAFADVREIVSRHISVLRDKLTNTAYRKDKLWTYFWEFSDCYPLLEKTRNVFVRTLFRESFLAHELYHHTKIQVEKHEATEEQKRKEDELKRIEQLQEELLQEEQAKKQNISKKQKQEENKRRKEEALRAELAEKKKLSKLQEEEKEKEKERERLEALRAKEIAAERVSEETDEFDVLFGHRLLAKNQQAKFVKPGSSKDKKKKLKASAGTTHANVPIPSQQIGIALPVSSSTHQAPSSANKVSQKQQKGPEASLPATNNNSPSGQKAPKVAKQSKTIDESPASNITFAVSDFITHSRKEKDFSTTTPATTSTTRSPPKVVPNKWTTPLQVAQKPIAAPESSNLVVVPSDRDHLDLLFPTASQTLSSTVSSAPQKSKPTSYPPTSDNSKKDFPPVSLNGFPGAHTVSSPPKPFGSIGNHHSAPHPNFKPTPSAFPFASHHQPPTSTSGPSSPQKPYFAPASSNPWAGMGGPSRLFGSPSTDQLNRPTSSIKYPEFFGMPPHENPYGPTSSSSSHLGNHIGNPLNFPPSFEPSDPFLSSSSPYGGSSNHGQSSHPHTQSMNSDFNFGGQPSFMPSRMHQTSSAFYPQDPGYQQDSFIEMMVQHVFDDPKNEKPFDSTWKVPAPSSSIWEPITPQLNGFPYTAPSTDQHTSNFWNAPLVTQQPPPPRPPPSTQSEYTSPLLSGLSLNPHAESHNPFDK